MIDKKYSVIKIDKNSALPMANQLARQLTWLIADGVIKKGEKLPPIRDYSKILGIHHHTVRAAYHQLEERNLVDIHAKIGTVVKEYIPFVSSDRKDYIGNEMLVILVPAISDFYQQIIAGIESVAFERKLIPIVLDCHEDPIYAEAIYKNLSARNIAGIINISLGFSDKFYRDFEKEENLNIPLVFLDVADANSHSIKVNTSAAVDMASRHMLDHGYGDLALINCPADWPIGREVLKGFRSALRSRDKDFDSTLIFTVPEFGFDAGEFIVERMLQRDPIPQAIIAVSDTLALGAMRKLKQKGLRIPEDIAIIGFNDIFSASIVEPPLTTIALPLFEMGEQSMHTLNKILNGNMKKWIHEKFSGELVIRKSCGCSS